MEYFYNKNSLEVGIDEAGRGCLAGPVVVGAVILPEDIEEYSFEWNDSKKLSKKKRESLREEIEEVALDYSVSYGDNKLIDKVNILNATHKTMHDCIKKLNITPEYIIVDGNSFKPYFDINGEIIPHTCIIQGDSKYSSISAASILAKTYHDDFIEDLLLKEPELKNYGWEKNMCYGTETHLNGIKKYGISKYHRRTFGICKNF